MSNQTFDPFLRALVGAEIAISPGGIQRAINGLVGGQVLVATERDGQLRLGRLRADLRLTVAAPIPSPGDIIAISDQRGLRHIGIQGTVALALDADEILIETPERAVFFPGRTHRRLSGSLGARVMLEIGDELMPARGIDVSAGGLGLILPSTDSFTVGDNFVVYLQFKGESLRLPAQLMSLVEDHGIHRAGIRFAPASEAVAQRIHLALTSRL